MTFKKGKSGNPSGRPQGAINKRTQITKLLEPHAEQLIAKILELALAGDINALRLCMDRLVPKPQREPLGIQLPKVIDESNVDEIKNNILNAIFDGVILVDQAEKLINLISREVKSSKNLSYTLGSVVDPVEASRIYQQIMSGKYDTLS